ncbi:hypothetical protein AtubIFM57143_010333 [Aspergillus tubingensis]|nr:hypothetical protein AtubIFM57143_010333 [Aspergillus tubingensis]
MEDVERLARTNAPWVKALGADAVLKRRGYAVALINVDVDVIGRSNPLKRQRELAKRLLAANTHRWAATPTDITYVGWARPWKRVVQEGRPHGSKRARLQNFTAKRTAGWGIGPGQQILRLVSAAKRTVRKKFQEQWSKQ